MMKQLHRERSKRRVLGLGGRGLRHDVNFCSSTFYFLAPPICSFEKPEIEILGSTMNFQMTRCLGIIIRNSYDAKF